MSARSFPLTRYGGDGATTVASRLVAEEAPVALVHDGATHAVMMATPADLEDFAVGFALSEGVIASLADLREVEVIAHALGHEARLWLAPGAGARAAERRRLIAGPTGCGLCGVESLEAARRPARRIAATARVTAADIRAAVAALGAGQVLGGRTRAAHAAGLYLPGLGLVALREDVGRHNALDKLIGAAARGGLDATAGIAVITSRVSIEMVQKTAMLGAPVLVAVSAPTDLAIETARAAELTLVAVARDDGFEVFTRADRIAS